jgi:biopolymer transport protein ExbD
VAARPLGENGGEEGGVSAEINVTPLTDVFLVLLIIFMITASVASRQGKEIDLPEAAVSSTVEQGVTVTITDANEIQVDGRGVAPEQLRDALAAALKKAEKKLVILRGDQAIRYGLAVTILDMAQEVGAEGIALATTKRRPELTGG